MTLVRRYTAAWGPRLNQTEQVWNDFTSYPPGKVVIISGGQPPGTFLLTVLVKL